MKGWLEGVFGSPESAVEARWVVVDCETSGLDPHRDSLIALAGVGVRGQRIASEDCFEVTVRPGTASERENILVHGIGRDRQAAGRRHRSRSAPFWLTPE